MASNCPLPFRSHQRHETPVVRPGVVEDVEHADPGRRVRLEVTLASNDLGLGVTIVFSEEPPPVDREVYAGHFVQRLPDWYRQHINAPTFLLLPLQIKSAPFGLIYADKASASDIALDEKELALLKTLRNQAVMAFRQAG